MRVKLLACEVFFREVCHLAAQSPTTCDLEFLPKGLHDLGAERMLARLQERVDAAPEGYDAIALAYGICNNGVVGLTARSTRLVIPKAHDCMTLFMGDRKRYREYFESNPGTYYRTSGWFEHASSGGAGEDTVPQRLGLFQDHKKLVEQYGEENAQYIMETMGNSTANYSRLTFINMGLPRDPVFREMARAEAVKHGWTFDELKGSLELLRGLIDGEWDDRFVTVEPGCALRPVYSDPDEVLCSRCGQ